ARTLSIVQLLYTPHTSNSPALLSLHDALRSRRRRLWWANRESPGFRHGECQEFYGSAYGSSFFASEELARKRILKGFQGDGQRRSEEHTSELQSRFDLVCRLLLEKKKVCNTS